MKMKETGQTISFRSKIYNDEMLRFRLRRSKTIATGLLLFMVSAFIASRALESTYSWLGPVIAFTEAAMVGAVCLLYTSEAETVG